MKKCEYCNQNEVLIGYDGKPLRFCSPPCKKAYITETKRKTNLEKYGTTNVLNNPVIKQKSKQTMLRKYGVESALASQAVRDKGKATNLERYGFEHACQSPIIQEKIKDAWSGYEGGHPWSDTVVRQKREDTLIEMYGVKHPILNQEIYDKIISTNLEKYGFENAAKSDIVSQKISTSRLTEESRAKFEQTSIEKYGVRNPNQRQIQSQLLFLDDEQWLREQVGNLGYVGVATLLDVSTDTVRSYSNKFKLSPPTKSSFENQVLTFIKSVYTGEIINNIRLVNNKEIDIYLPELSLAFECNGSYWHSELNGRERSYHLNKSKSLAEIEIHLVHIWEHDWEQHQKIIKSRIKSLLGENKTIYARKCIVKLVDTIETTTFLVQNHIQGHSQSSIRLGLYHNGKLVSLMTFGKSRFKGKAEYELLRYVNLLDHTVVGGASKLFKYFITYYNPTSVLSYSDKSFNRGTLYSMLGFTKTHSSAPAYYYTKNYRQFDNRIKFQKHKLKNLLAVFDPALSEWDNMKLNGYDRIWDCGNDVWLYNAFNKSNTSSL